MGLRFTGVLGILLEAKAQGLLPAVRPLLEALRDKAPFSMDEPLFRTALDLAAVSAGRQHWSVWCVRDRSRPFPRGFQHLADQSGMVPVSFIQRALD